VLLEAYFHDQIGQAGRALSLVESAVAWKRQSGWHAVLSELYRVRGDLLLKTGHDEALAESSFEEAIDIARRQKGKWWELRAAMSMARLWQQQGKRAEARELLAGVYDWFTEGFDTRDQREAKALLEELSLP
jgi:predicted ATPase